MRNWHSLYEILKFPLQMVILSVVLCGLGNLIVNPYYGLSMIVDSEGLRICGQIIQRTGTFMLVNYPLFFMISAVIKKGSSAITVISALSGYVAFLVSTMFFAPSNLTTNAYTSTFGLSYTTTSAFTSGVTKYPLQTGVLGAVIVVFITLFMFSMSRKKSEYGFFSFISKEMTCVVGTTVLSGIAGIAVSFVWPYFVSLIQNIVSFIANDTTNPINMALYGIMDRTSNLFNLSALVRQPFWYTIQGGSWMSLTGASITGDVNIWASQIASSSVTPLTGRFITPYYILNLFAMPAMMAAMYSLCNEPVSKRKYRGAMVACILISWLSGSLLPLEIMMLFLCPFLLLIHLGLSGILFALLQSMHIYLGYNSASTLLISAMPGTLPEFLSYLGNPALRSTLLWVVIVGIVTAVVYFVVTRLYFLHMAVDLFQTGDLERMVAAVIKGVGGLENIRRIESSFDSLTISLYDPTKLRPSRFRSLGVFRIFDTRSGFRINLGACSTMVKNEIEHQIRETVR
ncbi:MAG: PTS transporter subunit EIIC [Bulleidia sp.]